MATLPDASPLSTFSSIMVPVGLGAQTERRVKFAVELADRFSSHLVGVGVEELIPPLYFEGSIGGTPGYIELEKQRVATDLKQAEVLFRGLAGTRSAEWRSDVTLPSPFLCKQARACDLVVVSRQGIHDEQQGLMAVAPADVVMSAGRPILVLPPLKERATFNRIVVAWKDAREARRAIWDGLPLLKRADTVFILAVGRRELKESVDDVAAYLRRHGISGKPIVRAEGERSVGDDIMQFVDDEGADLIISGAFGQSRAREWIFGGVTRDLLNETRVCCLLSH
jgi:nucleotide-binding universal stress UspA family protein